MEFPRKTERDYIAVIDIAAVLIVSGADGFVRASRDLEASERTFREIWPQARVISAWWVKDRDTAEQLARAVNKRLLDGVASVEQMRAEIMAQAALSGLKLTQHATVMKRVSAAARRVDEALRVANGRGELAWFNRAYREYRLRGCRSMSYGEARARLRRAMMRRMVLVERLEFGPEMLSEVFGAALCTAK